MLRYRKVPLRDSAVDVRIASRRNVTQLRDIGFGRTIGTA